MPETPLLVIPDAGPLITLAYADSLDLLQATGAEVWIVDMVRHEVTRTATPTSERIAEWIDTRSVDVVPTALFEHHRQRLADAVTPPRKANLGELAAQEVMNALARARPPRQAVFLFEDHRIATAGFVLPDGCSTVSTRAWLRFLERIGCIESAWAIERRAIDNGRAFSSLRFSTDDTVRETLPAYGDDGDDGRAGRASRHPIGPRTASGAARQAMSTHPSRTARRGPDTVEILQLLVTLEHVQPPVTRTLLLRASSPLSTLHTALQNAMPWTDSHLHEFEKDGVRYGPDWYLDEEPELSLESERKQLGTLFRSGADTLGYLYDFGDGWQHTVTLEARLPPDLALRHPRCTAGENACPPEDVGGPGGYARLLEIMSDPRHEDHASTRAWVGGDVDPNGFDLQAAEARLAQAFPSTGRAVARA